jgi:ribosomal protein L32
MSVPKKKVSFRRRALKRKLRFSQAERILSNYGPCERSVGPKQLIKRRHHLNG